MPVLDRYGENDQVGVNKSALLRKNAGVYHLAYQ